MNPAPASFVQKIGHCIEMARQTACRVDSGSKLQIHAIMCASEWLTETKCRTEANSNVIWDQSRFRRDVYLITHASANQFILMVDCEPEAKKKKNEKCIKPCHDSGENT